MMVKGAREDDMHLLIGLVGAFRVADLGLEIRALLLDVVLRKREIAGWNSIEKTHSDADEVRPLRICESVSDDDRGERRRADLYPRSS